MNRSKIVVDYFKFWFWLDLISSTPYSWFIAWSYGISIYELEQGGIGNSGFSPTLLKLIKIARLLKMLKLLRLIKL